MRNVTSDYLAQVKSGARQFGFMVQVQSGAGKETLLLADIVSIDITRSISDQLQIGACMSDRLTLQTKTTNLFNERGKKIWVYYRCTEPILDWVLLGTFYVDGCVTERGITAVTAYDMMSRLDKKVRWIDVSTATAPTFPCTMQDMLDYLCNRARVTTDFVCQNIIVDKPPDGYTARELISYIAASHGGNARFSPEEVLQIRPYTQTSEVISYGDCYSLDVASDNGYEVKGILFDRGGDDKIYIDGTSAEYDEESNGVVQSFNPFATVGIAEYAWNRLGGLKYSAVSLEMPATNIFEPGDVITVQKSDESTAVAIVMEQMLSVSCTGGFVEKISCTAQSKSQERNANNRMEHTEAQVSEVGGDVYAVKTRESATSTEHNEYWDIGELRAYMVPGGYASGISTVLKNNEPKGDIYFGEFGEIEISTGGNNQSFTGKFKVDFQDLGSTTASVGYKISLYNSKNGIDSGLIIKLANGKLEVGSNDIKICVDYDIANTGQLTFTIGGKKYRVQAIEVT